MTPSAIIILMVEDDEGHARLIERNIRRAGATNEIVHLRDGATALAYLAGLRHESAGAAGRAFLVLLDMNLPDMSGADILARVKRDAVLKRLPVIVLTTTDDRHEVERCYELGCNAYVTKPVVQDRFAECMRHLGGFLSVIQTPEWA